MIGIGQRWKKKIHAKTVPTCECDLAVGLSPWVLGHASVVAKVLLGQILYVQTHFHLQCKMGMKKIFSSLLLYWLTLSMVTVGQLLWDDIKILELGLGHLISKF